MNQTPFSIETVNEFSGTTKVLDENPDTGKIVRHWQKAGCDPKNIAITIHRYVIGYLSKLNAHRKERTSETSARRPGRSVFGAVYHAPLPYKLSPRNV
jgi:hypothetical protein